MSIVAYCDPELPSTLLALPPGEGPLTRSPRRHRSAEPSKLRVAVVWQGDDPAPVGEVQDLSLL